MYGASTWSTPSSGHGSWLPRPSPELIRYARRLSDLRDHPTPAVLDTSCVRTGLKVQLDTGELPPSIRAAADGDIRLFMELDTLEETFERLPRFANQLNVGLDELTGMFVEDWLPLISVVSLPAELRGLDARAEDVRVRDPDDYPAAALAALLSPCVLLTHNYKDFGALGVRSYAQGIDAIGAAIEVQIGEFHLQAAVTVPALPLVAGGAGVKWAWGRMGPYALFLLGGLLLGGIVLYRRQPAARRERIKAVARDLGDAVLEMSSQAAAHLQQAERLLEAYVVPPPELRSAESEVLRALATSDYSLSAQQLYEELDQEGRPSVARLRSFLRAYEGSVFDQVRRGGFVVGQTLAPEQTEGDSLPLEEQSTSKGS